MKICISVEYNRLYNRAIYISIENLSEINFHYGLYTFCLKKFLTRLYLIFYNFILYLVVLQNYILKK